MFGRSCWLSRDVGTDLFCVCDAPVTLFSFPDVLCCTCVSPYRDGMDLITRMDTAGFSKYLSETGNTVCGRHPIAVCLFMLTAFDDKFAGVGAGHSVLFTKYAQSSPARTLNDSSVSYASAVIMRT